MNGRQRKEQGILQVTYNNGEFLALMRKWAITRIRRVGTVDANYLRRRAAERGITPKSVNAWGAVWRDPIFRPVGHTMATTPSCHGREIKVWTLA